MKPVVAHVITGLNTGGAEQMLAQLVERQAHSAFRHVVICLTDAGPIADRILLAGVPVHDLGMHRNVPSPIAVIKLARIIRTERAAVVQTWLYHADLIGGLAASLARRPVAWNIRRSSLDPAITGRGVMLTARLCARLSGRLPRAIVCCADAARQSHVAFGYDAPKMRVIPNGFDTNRFQPDPDVRRRIRDELGLDADNLAVAILGRFVSQKNHRMFVEAASQIASAHPDARFIMAGRGLDSGNAVLGGWIAATGLQDRFRLLGLRADVPDLLTGLDIVTLTSHTEGFPNVIGEAMAAGVPCVATDVGDTALLLGETGKVTPRGDTSAFASAVGEKLAMDRMNRMNEGVRGRARIIENFEITRIARQYDDLWQSLVSG